MENSRKGRRPRTRPKQRCRRESCNRKRDGTYCSPLCENVDRELQAIQGLIGRAGSGTVVTELWLSAVQLNDALTEVYRLKSVLFHIAERQTSGDETSSRADQTSRTTNPQTFPGAVDPQTFPGTNPSTLKGNQTLCST